MLFLFEDKVMAVSQPATFNEEWSDERVYAYLNHLPPTGVNADYHVLYNAYKHMRPYDFERLIKKFKEDGRNIEATNPQGETIAQTISAFPKHSLPFLEILKKYS